MNVIRGLLPAALTPMHSNGDINFETVATQAKYFSQVGAAGVFINGTSAEWTSLTVDERKALTSEWMAQADESLSIIDHVGHHCQRDAISLAEHAASCEVGGISIVAPSYFKIDSAQGIVDWCKPIATAAGNIPFYYYDLPQLTGVSIPAYDVAKLAKEQIPTFAGIKFSSGDPIGAQHCLSIEDCQVFWGSDENLLVGLALGCTAAVGSTYNLMIPHYTKIIEYFNSGDMPSARQLQKTALLAVECMIPHGVMPSLKALQPLSGYELGGSRLPFYTLDKAAAKRLYEKILALSVVEKNHEGNSDNSK